ncbi:hypothetical protein D3C80_2121870 [compost metagenome]
MLLPPFGGLGGVTGIDGSGVMFEFVPVSPFTMALAMLSALYLSASALLSTKQHSTNIAGATVFLKT